MRNLITYEGYDEEVSEGMFQKFITGHESSDARRQAMEEFIGALNQAEDLVMARPNDFAQSGNWERTKEMLKNQARENNFKGGIDIRPSASNNLLYVTYMPGISGLQALAGSVAFRRDNPLGRG